MSIEDLVLDGDIDWTDTIPAAFHKPGLYLSTGPMYGGKTSTAIQSLEQKTRPILNVKRGDVNDIAIGIQPSINERDLEHETIRGRLLQSTLRYGVIDHQTPHELFTEPYVSKPIWFIEEIQFFTEPIVEVIDLAIEQGRMIFATGLNRTFAGEVFGSIGDLSALAEPSSELYASCQVCGNPASRTQRLVKRGELYVPAPIDAPQVSVEGNVQERYEPRCWQHHDVPGRYEQIRDRLVSKIRGPAQI